MSKHLNIVIAASECVPFAKTGGLADVVGALPKELSKLGHTVSVIMPFYPSARSCKVDIEDIGVEIKVTLSDHVISAKILKSSIAKDVNVYFIDHPLYYDRPQLYSTADGDYLDNAERFIFFSKAVIELLKKIEMKPDIIHCNDWQTGLVPVFLKLKENHNPFFAKTATVFTIHNLAYQGLFWHLDMPLTNLSWDVFTPDGIEFYGKINLMKAGIVYADVINTVSKTYSQEIQTEKLGCGLDGILRKRSDDLYGIINGVDYEIWNPETDPFIPAHYSVDDMSGKETCKQALLEEYGLKNPRNFPVVAMISRLADQKGFDLIAEKIDMIMSLNLILIILGTGDKKYHRLFESISKKYPDHIGIKIAFDNALAHKIEAGADFFLMPSLFEPCGLNQLYSLRYGTPPIVHATGGLNDTIKNFSLKTHRGTGLSFKSYNSTSLLKKLQDVLKIYKDKSAFAALRHNGMTADFSWMVAAKQYEKLYINALKKR